MHSRRFRAFKLDSELNFLIRVCWFRFQRFDFRPLPMLRSCSKIGDVIQSSDKFREAWVMLEAILVSDVAHGKS